MTAPIPVSRTGATDREVDEFVCTIDDCDICDPDPLTAQRDDYGHTEADHDAAGACIRPSMEARRAADLYVELGPDWQRAWMVGYDAGRAALLAEQPGGGEQRECTGMMASWCDAHGACACPRSDEDTWLHAGPSDDPGCPLHAPNSQHGEQPGGGK